MSTPSTLIIKLGAMGDVLRTTTILRRLDAPVTWVTRPASLALLENLPQVGELLALDAAPAALQGRHYRLAACLDDEPEACRLLDLVTWDRHVGAFLQDGAVRYGESARPWYDMGLLSRFGKERADELKRLNTRTYQDYLFEMFGLRFSGEEYLFGYAPREASPRRVGIEMRADPRWRWKRWVRYPELIETLRADGMDVFVFEQRDDLRDFIADVNSCAVVVTGDTLTMHIALALGKRIVTVFGPTSATEIHDYGRLVKAQSPIECVVCYLRECDKAPNCMDLIPLERLREEVRLARRDLEAAR
jgi:heptosyltransferase-2